jgi:hypothetical protein
MVMACQKSEPAPNGDDDKPARPLPGETAAQIWTGVVATTGRPKME